MIKPIFQRLHITIIISIFFASVTFIFMGYRYRVPNLGHFYGWSTTLEFFRLQNIFAMPVEPSIKGVVNLSFGAAFVIFLSLVRQRFWWWSFHPLGFVMGDTYPMILLWFSTLIGWLPKWTTLRFGGIRVYNKLRPFFLGLVPGEYLSGSMWVAVGAITKKSYQIFF